MLRRKFGLGAVLKQCDADGKERGDRVRTCLNSVKSPAGRLARCSLYLRDFDCQIKYKRGAHNTDADALSRRGTDEELQPSDSRTAPPDVRTSFPTGSQASSASQVGGARKTESGPSRCGKCQMRRTRHADVSDCEQELGRNVNEIEEGCRLPSKKCENRPCERHTRSNGKPLSGRRVDPLRRCLTAMSCLCP